MSTNAADILNTPGYFYAISYIFSCLVILMTNRRRFRIWKANILHGGIFAFLLGFMILTDGVRTWLFVPSMCMIIGLILADLYFGCDCTFLQACYYCLKAFINGEFAASLCWQIYYHFSRRIAVDNPQLWKWMEILGVYIVVYGFFYLLEKKLHADTEELHITGRELLVVAVISVSVY